MIRRRGEACRRVFDRAEGQAAAVDTAKDAADAARNTVVGRSLSGPSSNYWRGAFRRAT